jgi:hypothetical protein
MSIDVPFAASAGRIVAQKQRPDTKSISGRENVAL